MTRKVKKAEPEKFDYLLAATKIDLAANKAIREIREWQREGENRSDYFVYVVRQLAENDYCSDVAREYNCQIHNLDLGSDNMLVKDYRLAKETLDAIKVKADNAVKDALAELVAWATDGHCKAVRLAYHYDHVDEGLWRAFYEACRKRVLQIVDDISFEQVLTSTETVVLDNADFVHNMNLYLASVNAAKEDSKPVKKKK